MFKGISFDLGASSGKVFVFLFDGGKIKLKKIHSFKNGAHDLNGDLYWNFVYIFNELKKGISKAVSEHKDIFTFGLCSFSNDFGFINKNGELISQVRSYRDKRTIRNEKRIYNLISKEKLYEITGNQIAPFNAFMQLASMRADGLDDEIDSAHQILFLPDLINYFLCGEKITEKSIASVSQIYDQGKGDWSNEILKKLKLRKTVFPPLEDAGKILGKINKNLFAAKANIDIAICPHHDTASAFIGSPFAKDTLKISSGTWGIVGTETEAPTINVYGFKNNIANECGPAGYSRLLLNTMGNFPMQEILKAEEGTFDYRRAYEKLKSKGASEFIDINKKSFFAPENMKEKIAKEYHKKYKRGLKNLDDYYMLITKSLAVKFGEAKAKLEKQTGKKFSQVSIVGGGCKDKLAIKCIKDELGIPVFSGPENASALGNAIFQLIAKGELKNAEEGRELIKRTFVKKA